MDEPILMELFTLAVNNLRMCMKNLAGLFWFKPF